jgi:hypothetical protein
MSEDFVKYYLGETEQQKTIHTESTVVTNNNTDIYLATYWHEDPGYILIPVVAWIVTLDLDNHNFSAEPLGYQTSTHTKGITIVYNKDTNVWQTYSDGFGEGLETMRIYLKDAYARHTMGDTPTQ